MKKSRPAKQRMIYHRVFVVAIILTIAAGWILTDFLGKFAEKGFKKDVDREASLIVSLLNDNLEDVDNAAKALSQSEKVAASLSSGSPADLERANRVLDRYKSSLEMSACFLMDGNGLVVASSNRNEDSGVVGKSFASRPYFKGALAGRLSHHFAFHDSTRERGYYAATPVVDKSGAITGVAVAKKNIASIIEEAFRKYSHAYLVSPEGVIFISSRAELLSRTLWPVDEKRRPELLASRQFGSIMFEPLLAEEPRTGTYVRFDDHEHYLERLPIGSEGWTLVYMEQPHIVSKYRLFGILLTSVFGFLLLFFFKLMLHKDKSLEAARELLKAKDDWERTFDAVPDLIAIIDNDFRISRMNSSMADRLGISKEGAIGIHCHELLHCNEKPCHVCPHRKALGSGRVSSESRFEKALNAHFVVTAAPIGAQDGGLAASVYVMHDITELKRLEQSQQENAERLAMALEGSNDGMFEWDMIANQAYWNARYYELTEYAPEEVNVNYDFFMRTIHPDDVADVQKRVQEHLDGKIGKYEAHYRMVTKSGKLRNVMGRGKIVRYDEDGRPIKMAGVVTDVTDMKRLGDEVNRIHNLESIGLLAGGLAHDFNNVLNIIYGNITFAKMLAKGDAAVTEPLTDAEEACERAKEFGIRLQVFSQGSSPVKEPIALPAIIEDAAGTLFKGSNLALTIAAADDLLPIEADPRQIRQVFENLLTNAKEATAAGGTVKISIENYRVDGKGGIPLVSGSYLRIAVQDEGKGIPEENLPKIFDPYFSTKDTYSQRGMGLGLSTCHAILKRHGGHIFVESKPGAGTRVTIYLPASVE